MSIIDNHAVNTTRLPIFPEAAFTAASTPDSEANKIFRLPPDKLSKDVHDTEPRND